MKRRLTLVAAAMLVAVSATSCLNVFSPVDQPSGDAQLLSAARAALDRGDFPTALADYQKLSSSQADTAASEQAMAALNQQGATMNVFLEFIGNGANGSALTTMASRLTPGSLSKRNALYNAFVLSGVKSGGTRSNILYFTQFMTGLALAAELLAEAQGNGSSLLKTQIVDNPATCKADASCALNCQSTNATLTANSSADFGTPSASAPSDANPTADLFFWAVKYTLNGLNSLGASGAFGTTSSGLTSIFNNGQPSSAPSPQTDRCFRAQLLNFGVGI